MEAALGSNHPFNYFLGNGLSSSFDVAGRGLDVEEENLTIDQDTSLELEERVLRYNLRPWIGYQNDFGGSSMGGLSKNTTLGSKYLGRGMKSFILLDQ